MFSWLLRPLHINQMLFCHRPDPMLVLEINPVVGSVVCSVQGYLGKFLYYKALTGWPWENLLKKKKKIYIYIYISHHIQVTINITRWDPLTWTIVNACSGPGRKFEFSSSTQTQSEQQAKFQQRNKSPTIMGWIYIW